MYKEWIRIVDKQDKAYIQREKVAIFIRLHVQRKLCKLELFSLSLSLILFFYMNVALNAFGRCKHGVTRGSKTLDPLLNHPTIHPTYRNTIFLLYTSIHLQAPSRPVDIMLPMYSWMLKIRLHLVYLPYPLCTKHLRLQ